MWRAIDTLRRLPLVDFQQHRRTHAASSPPTLSSAKLKLIDGCNLRCFMCDYWQGRREGELSTEEVLRVLRDLQALGCRKVHFTGGEILMRKDALQLFAEAASLGMRVNLTTNGTLLDKEKVRALTRIPVRSVTLSLDSPIRKVHDEVRGREGAFKKTLGALDGLLARRKPKTRVRLNMVVSARTYRTLLDLPAMLEERPLDGLLLIPMDTKPATGHAGVGARLPVVRPTPFAMSAEDIRRFNAEIAPVLAERIRVPGFDAFPFGRGEGDVALGAAGDYARGHYVERRCHVPWFHTLVSSIGDVYPCCMGHRTLAPLGNVRQAPLPDIWRGEAYRRFREGMLVERPAICHQCDDFLAENRAYDALVAEREAEAPPA